MLNAPRAHAGQADLHTWVPRTPRLQHSSSCARILPKHTQQGDWSRSQPSLPPVSMDSMEPRPASRSPSQPRRPDATTPDRRRHSTSSASRAPTNSPGRASAKVRDDPNVGVVVRAGSNALQVRNDLDVGVVVRVGSNTLQVIALLGQGSFGAVWEASRCDAGDTVALKDIACQTGSALEAAVGEAEVLRDLEQLQGPGAAGHPEAIRRIPRLLGVEFEKVAHEEWRALLAMTKLPGIPLNEYLKAPRPELRNHHEACKFVLEMLLQLIPVFEHICARTYHRDAHARNIMIEDEGHRPPQFGLVDFGLTVHAKRWREADWQRSGVAGDCRYWPPSAWAILEFGSVTLETCEALRVEYQERLDYHSLGLTAIQALSVLVPNVASLSESSHGSSLFNSLAKAWDALIAAWTVYWAAATHLWELVCAAFRRGDSATFRELQLQFEEAHVHATIEDTLSAVRASLHTLREAYGAHVASSLKPGAGDASDTSRLLDVLVDMISGGGEAASTWTNLRETLQDVGVMAAAASTKVAQAGGAAASAPKVRSVAKSGSGAPRPGKLSDWPETRSLASAMTATPTSSTGSMLSTSQAPSPKVAGPLAPPPTLQALPSSSFQRFSWAPPLVQEPLAPFPRAAGPKPP